MADIMRPIPFGNLVERVIGELKNQKSIFGIHYDEFYHDEGKHKVPVFNQYCTMPLGPAAGPHTQLAQNIITSYLVGSRFIELKTVQIMDTLEIEKPCIDARDEGYNVEWSTEYTIPKAFDEYLKAWIVVHMLQCCQQNGEFTSPSFIFNMSVGYNLEGIKQERMQWYIDSMIDCSKVPTFEKYKNELCELLDKGLLSGTPYDGLEEKVKAMLPLISPHISPNVTISTMHGCPPKEIEAICTYMLTEKHLDTFVKLNPTLLGYDTVRGILDDLGFNYVGLRRDTFTKDLQYPDAVSMLTRLIALGKKEKKVFGVKLTNTLGSVNDQGQLPGEEMYMSGRTLLPISTTVARKLSHEFGGLLPISYSGGATALTVKDLFETGIRPITLATDMLKPGGYSRLTQLADILNGSDAWDMNIIDLDKLDKLNDKARDPEYITNKDFRGTDRAKIGTPLSLIDCYVAPCVVACPIHQDIPEYIQLMGAGAKAEALSVILEKNALPNITGWICDHQCQLHCTRMDYEGAIHIREVKRLAAEEGREEYLSTIWEKPEEPTEIKAAVIGAGPAGLASCLFLARAGFDVTLFEREKTAGGVVRQVIPEFRIPEEIVQRDVDFILSHGVKTHFGAKAEETTVDALKKAGFDYLFYATGAEKERGLKLTGNGKVVDAIEYLASLKKGEDLKLGKNVVVVGGGNTAMDAARALLKSGKNVTDIYRRSVSEMPADKEEYKLAKNEGVKFMFLANPSDLTDGILTVDKMALGEKDSSGRRRPVETGGKETIPCDAVVAAVGEMPHGERLSALGLVLNEKGYPLGDESRGIYVVGDMASGPSTVVRCMASARKAVDECIASINEEVEDNTEEEITELSESELDELTKAENLYFRELREKKHHICTSCNTPCGDELLKREAKRCLECSYLCNKCTEVCPNRANVAVDVRNYGFFENPYQILHIDAYCNECGNCEAFCPHDGGPYLKKFTLFSRQDDFENSTNSGFLKDGEQIILRLDGKVSKGSIKNNAIELDAPNEILALINEVFVSYSYLLNKVDE
ncbi:MAG: putative selenate reductase subunit YgfK [Spirochaetales bacterium]|nr:putative selenate reductase subunit YgfK [Spirochaetales bacterium]